MTAYTLTAATGTVALSGNTTTLSYGYRLTAADAAFYVIDFPTSRFTYGTVSTPKSFQKTAFENPAFVVDGLYLLSAGTGVVTLAGNSATLTMVRQLVAAAGTYVLTGNAAALRADRMMIADATTYDVAVNDVEFYTEDMLGGAYVVATPNVQFFVGRRINADAGAFAVTGVAARMYHSVYFTGDVERSYVREEPRSAIIGSEYRKSKVKAETKVRAVLAENRQGNVPNRRSA